MEFPDWAPEYLRNLYHHNYKDFNDSVKGSPHNSLEGKSLFERLLSEDEMRKVWSQVQRSAQRKKMSPGEIKGVMISVIMGTQEAYYLATSNQRSKREMRDGYLRIVKLASKLSNELRFWGEDDAPVCRWFPESSLIEIIRRIRGEKVTPCGPKNRDPRIGISYLLEPFIPTTREVLASIKEGYSKKADDIKSRAYCRIEEAPTSRPYAEKARRVIFVRYLGSRLEKIFGSPHYGTLATLASTALGDDIDAGAVREILRVRPQRG